MSQARDTAFYDTGSEAPVSGMDRSYYALNGIKDEQRDAVGSVGAKDELFVVGSERVALRE